MSSNLTVDVSGMSMAELQAQSALLMQEQISRMSREMEKVKDEVIKEKTRREVLEAEVNHIKKKQDDQMQVSINALRAREAKDGWVNLTNFGLMFNSTLSNRRVGKLLKVTEIAQRNTGKTLPRREHVGDGKLCCTRITLEGHSQLLWNFRRCMAHIDLWLERNGHLEEFYEKENENELAGFVDWLYEKYVPKRTSTGTGVQIRRLK